MKECRRKAFNQAGSHCGEAPLLRGGEAALFSGARGDGRRRSERPRHRATFFGGLFDGCLLNAAVTSCLSAHASNHWMSQ